jgi:cytochrome c oxidase subunit 1
MFFGIITSFVLFLHDMQNLFYDIDYITAQFHYIIAVFAVFSGFYTCFKKITGFCYSEVLGQVHFWSFFLGVNLTFFPTFFLVLKVYNEQM